MLGVSPHTLSPVMSAELPSPEYGEGAAPLTAYERARLRPTVDPAALQRFLEASGGEVRRLVIAHFACGVLVEDLAVLDPELDAEWGGTPPPGFVEPDGRRFRSTVSFDLQLSVDDTALAPLWTAIEPAGHEDGPAPPAS